MSPDYGKSLGEGAEKAMKGMLLGYALLFGAVLVVGVSLVAILVTLAIGSLM